MIREVTTYKIDGVDKDFASLEDAQRYLGEKNNQAEVNYYRYIRNSWSGKRLVDKYKLDDYGIWEILGEDSNADFGGHHHMPSLGLVEGTLEQAIRYATSLDAFYSWGSGGDIVKRDAPKKLEK